jgi:flavin-binding protein dodecin
MGMQQHMSDTSSTVYRKTEIVGTSTVGYDDAIKHAVERARKTLRNVQWFEVTEHRGKITNSGIEYQATLEVGFALEDTTS